MTPSPPRVPGVRAAIGLATRALPTRDDRYRYLDEFLGDLYGLSAGEQVRYAAGVLSQALALRAALRADPRRLRARLTRGQRWRWFRCHVVRLHYWKTYSTDDGSRYMACSVCRREHPRGPGGGAQAYAPFASGAPGGGGFDGGGGV